VRKGDYARAISEFNRIQRADEYPPEGLAYAYAKRGDLEKARAIVRERETRRASLSVNDQAWTSAAGGLSDDLALGDTSGLLRRLRTMVDNNDQYLVNLKCEPYYDELIKIPQVQSLLVSAKVPI
jgi:hypothetical protein